MRRTGPGRVRTTSRCRKTLTNLGGFDAGTLKTYARMVGEMDLQVGRILKALDAARAARDTIIVFTSDNGGERFSDTWPFTGKKTELLEGGLRIPALVRWPGHIKPREHDPAGCDDHGLAADAARGRRDSAGPRLPPGWDQLAAFHHAERTARRRAESTGATGRMRSRRCATVT